MNQTLENKLITIDEKILAKTQEMRAARFTLAEGGSDYMSNLRHYRRLSGELDAFMLEREKVVKQRLDMLPITEEDK